MPKTKKQRGGVVVRRRRRPTKKIAHRRTIRIRSPRYRSNTPNSTRSRSRNQGSPRNECASLYSALDYIPEMPNISNEEMERRLERVRARIDELGCGNSGRTD